MANPVLVTRFSRLYFKSKYSEVKQASQSYRIYVLAHFSPNALKDRITCCLLARALPSYFVLSDVTQLELLRIFVRQSTPLLNYR